MVGIGRAVFGPEIIGLEADVCAPPGGVPLEDGRQLFSGQTALGKEPSAISWMMPLS